MNHKKTDVDIKMSLAKKCKFYFSTPFEEESDYVAKQRAETSYEKRLTDVEQLRKKV